MILLKKYSSNYFEKGKYDTKKLILATGRAAPLTSEQKIFIFII